MIIIVTTLVNDWRRVADKIMSMAWLIISKIRKFFHFQHSKQLLLTTVLLFAIVFSVIRLLWAASPDPGHLLSSIGDGYFVTAGPTTARTYTFPDASTTVLTTNALVSVAQGGTGTSSLTGVLIGNGTGAVTGTTSPSGLLVGTTATQTLTGKTIDVNDNTLTCDDVHPGYLAYANGTNFLCIARGGADEFLRTNAAGTNLEWASVASGPAGADTQLQYNDAGSFGASSSLSWDQSSKSLNVSGYLNFTTTTLPSVATTGTMKIFNQMVSGREMLSYRSDEATDYGFFQPSLYQNSVAIIGTAGNAALTFIGTGALTSSGPDSSIGFQDIGYFVNFVPTVTSTPKYTGNSEAFYYRGSVEGRNGYFFFARVAPDGSAATNMVYWAGLTDQTISAALLTNNPVGSRSGFAFSDGLGETNWMFSNRGGGTENRTSTGIAVAIDNVYDLYFYNAPRGSVVTWRIDNLTAGTTAEGSSSTGLPTSTVAMRAGVGVRVIASPSGNSLNMQKMYVEIPR